MSLLRHLRLGLGSLLRRSQSERDDADEVRHYLEEAAADYQARGLSRREALRRVRLELGGETQNRDRLRDYGWEHSLEALWVDLRQCLRRLASEPGFTFITLLLLAVGLGASTAIFSAVHTILLQPLPYPDAHRVVGIWDHDGDGGPAAVTFGTYHELRERSRSFDQLAVLKPWQPSLSGADTPQRLDGQRVSAGYFRSLGVGPALGRDFRDQDDRADGSREVVIGDALWRRSFGADPGILGRTILLDERPYSVIGVMAPDFENVTAPETEVWGLLQYDMTQGRAWGHHLRMLGRLRRDVPPESAARELDAIAADAVEAHPRPTWAGLGQGLLVRSLQDEITGPVRPVLLALLGAAALLLAIVCVNVSHLLLARGARRRGELALRTALGAGRERLVRQLLTESLVLAAGGGGIGLGVAALGVRAMKALGPADLPRLDAVSVDATVFAVALALTTLVGVAFGLLPALQAASADPRAALQGGSQRASARRHRGRSVLVVAEVALTVVLLAASGLLLRSLHGLLDVETGFRSAGVQTLQVQVSGERWSNQATEAFFDQALAAVRAVPGVRAAAFTSQLPLSGEQDVYGIRAGWLPPDAERGVFRYTVSQGYFDAMGIPLRRGRTFDRREIADGHRVAIVSESLARKHLPGSDPIGQPLRIGPADQPPYTIVGVVADVRQVSLAVDEAEAVYLPASQWHFADDVRSLVVHAADPDLALLADLRQAIWQVDADRPIVRVATMDELVAASVAERRFTWLLFQVFALASLLLAAAGLYGVLAGSVAERTRELGVRAALGASRQANTAVVLRQGLALAAAGAAAGIAAALAATRALDSMLYNISHLDPATHLAVAALVAAVAVAACGLPALRAGRVDPSTVLRAE